MKPYQQFRTIFAARITDVHPPKEGADPGLLVTDGGGSYVLSREWFDTNQPSPGKWLIEHEPGLWSVSKSEPEGTPVQPLPVAGYKPQSAVAIDCVNAMKTREELILRQLDMMKNDTEVDQRWLAIGRTQLEQAFMAINRSIFKPGRAELKGDLGATLSATSGMGQ